MRGKEGRKEKGSNAQREIWGITLKGNKVRGKEEGERNIEKNNCIRE